MSNEVLVGKTDFVKISSLDEGIELVLRYLLEELGYDVKKNNYGRGVELSKNGVRFDLTFDTFGFKYNSNFSFVIKYGSRYYSNEKYFRISFNKEIEYSEFTKKIQSILDHANAYVTAKMELQARKDSKKNNLESILPKLNLIVKEVFGEACKDVFILRNDSELELNSIEEKKYSGYPVFNIQIRNSIEELKSYVYVYGVDIKNFVRTNEEIYRSYSDGNKISKNIEYLMERAMFLEKIEILIPKMNELFLSEREA